MAGRSDAAAALRHLALHCAEHPDHALAERAVDAWLALTEHCERTGVTEHDVLMDLVAEPLAVTLRRCVRLEALGDGALTRVCGEGAVTSCADAPVAHIASVSAELDALVGYRERAIDVADAALAVLGVGAVLQLLVHLLSEHSVRSVEAMLDALVRRGRTLARSVMRCNRPAWRVRLCRLAARRSTAVPRTRCARC